MGTDIHAFVEIAHQPEAIQYRCVGEIDLNRDYDLFNILGNGRNYSFPREEWQTLAHTEPRGAPSDISHLAALRFYDLILGSSKPAQGDVPDHWFWQKDDCVTRKDAFHRVKVAKSFIGEVRQTLGLKANLRRGPYAYAAWKAVAKEVYHSPSYLTLSEIEAAFAANGIVESDLHLSYRAMLAFMRTYAGDPKSTAIRLMFWFDN